MPGPMDLWENSGNPFGGMPEPTEADADAQFGISRYLNQDNLPAIIDQLMAPQTEPVPLDDDVILPEPLPRDDARLKGITPYRETRPLRRSGM